MKSRRLKNKRKHLASDRPADGIVGVPGITLGSETNCASDQSQTNTTELQCVGLVLLKSKRDEELDTPLI